MQTDGHPQRDMPTTADNIDRSLARLDPISLAEMDAVSLMNRVDTKYVSSASLLPSLLDGLLAEYRVLEVEGQRRMPYTTLYFDTPGRECYYEHHNGHANRQKFRKRGYVVSGDSFFEIKQKTNRGRTVKKRIPIPAVESTFDETSAALVESVLHRSIELAPQVWTLFSRITLVGRAFAERVTIDLDLVFRDQQRQAELPGVMIVEVKQQRDSRDSPLRMLLREMRVSPLRVSKYCVGSAMLNPTLKRNRFKMKLLALQHCMH